ncbi:thiol reductant ABC exporter subunit CydD [Paenibacillus radicis (ex Xue et al. 2023)]|uniref:Thiol reductant ABC exporter subunit CydD n=1 Tax=Paenibacillus radicis (ex Xue et al. 2023) TaxID=2972489 RepID=A0ABT1YBS6_9BACL|nr:thiol reductant ABC exporter subunit CydD [Paenibacillus radicis (ex Xue et al. 2023)]MCR8630649.1 thiol reductant ABC exporter subunit CydD [Paenibacillus radicis (ex Xue et al. 2023)]
MDRTLLMFKGIRAVLSIVTVFTLIQCCSMIVAAQALADIISECFAGAAIETQTSKLLLFALAFVVRHTMTLLQQRTSHRFAAITSETMRRRLMDKLFQLGPRFTGAQGTGSLTTLVLEGVTQFRSYVELVIPRMIGTAVVPAVLLIYICLQDTLVGLILTITMPILIVFMILIGLAAKSQVEKQHDSYRQLSNHFVDSLRGIETLKFLGQTRNHAATIEKVSDRFKSATMRTLKTAFLSSFALDFIAMLSVASVAVSLGLRLVNGTIWLAPALTVLILAPEYFLPIRMLGSDYHATLDGKEKGAAMMAILQLPSQPLPPIDGKKEASYGTWNEASHLTLSSVGVKHDEAAPYSLDAITLKLSGYGKIAIIGETGAGKSTLLEVIGGLLEPSSGQLTWDGCKLTDKFRNEAWRKETVYMPQHPYLFSGTLLDNIRFYRPEATVEEVKQAVFKTGLTGCIDSLPNGLEELIGGGGRPLSGGQAHRIALARAILSQRPVLLLDEPTAHLDIETEYELKEAMLPIFENKLVLLATHRLHWMPDMDQIYVLEHGKLAEAGTHEQLLARQGLYYRMMLSQLEEVL